MSGHQPELVDALLDGQLTGLRRWRVTRHVRACPLCAAEYRNQQRVRRLLRAHPPEPVLSDSAEFFWAKVKAEIERRDVEPVPAPEPSWTLAAWLREHQAAWATVAVTAAVVFAIAVFWNRRPVADRVAAPAPAPAVVAAVGRTTTSLPHTVATVLPGESADTTVIWVSGLPWTTDMTQLQTLCAHPDQYLGI